MNPSANMAESGDESERSDAEGSYYTESEPESESAVPHKLEVPSGPRPDTGCLVYCVRHPVSGALIEGE